jgi:hypothetical protein
MYVRSRRGPGGSNEQRSYRQQQVILELRRKLSDPAMLPRLPEILDAMADTVRTNLPPGQLGETIRLAQEADSAQVSQVFLGPEMYARELPDTESDLENAVELYLDVVAAFSLESWGDASYYSDPTHYDELMDALAIAAARCAQFPGWATSPAPAPDTKGAEPTLCVTTTGTPLAMASITARGYASSSQGNTNIAAERMASATSMCAILGRQ